MSAQRLDHVSQVYDYNLRDASTVVPTLRNVQLRIFFDPAIPPKLVSKSRVGFTPSMLQMLSDEIRLRARIVTRQESMLSE